MFRRKHFPAWIGIIVLSGVFLMGQESWTPPPVDDVFEENDSLQSAPRWPHNPQEAVCLCGSGFYGNCQGDCAIQNDDDWYEILADGVDLYVECYFSHAGGNIDMELYNGAGVRLGEAYSLTDNEGIGLMGEWPDGTYYIRVFGSDTGNVYDLSYIAD